ncbi:type VI secretion system baseplate subunit TssF [Niveispirillum sp. SYP-B3756]|uniref:type VI secretion system baseplate subunit TssF n=1 Tax=Niveispirillum sp. SYP-B3756 TaxID=2662178 RepID=UPI0015675FC3|nr:type VI secretion system baseplate subunit TssF [Niveispirillum sp. SYP-B3756]
MPREEADALFEAYERELLYLRNEGAEFAAAYPKVAGRLDFNGHESRDPHTERLLESFAFLTARIQRTLDADFPLIPAALLEATYPQLVAPVPSMAIARFEVDAGQARAALGFQLPDNIALFAQSTQEGLTCHFRSCYPLRLWPVEVAGMDLQMPERFPTLARLGATAGVLRLRLRALGTLTFADIRPDRLRFYLDADPMLAGILYELLLNNCHSVVLKAPGEGAAITLLPADAIRPVGFAEDEDVLPFPGHSHQAYRLIREYFCFPQKFQFIDVAGLSGWPAGQEAELLFLLDRVPDRAERLDRIQVRTNCTPIINLFPKTSEPVRLDQTQVEYKLTPDSRWERSCEVHSITKLSSVSNPGDDSRLVRPFFSYDHHAARAGADCFWIARRRPAVRADMPGSDIWLSLVDLKLDPGQPPSQTLYAHTLCTSRGMAEQLAPGTLLNLEVDAPVARVSCLNRPTRQIAAPQQGETLWQLVSSLSLNQLSLGDATAPEASLRALREILILYGHGGGAEVQQQAAGLYSLSARSLVRRIGSEAWRGFVRGTEVTLTLDETQFIGGSAFLLATVLDRFLALYAGINSFTQLVLKSRQRDGVWKTWPARVGARNVL